MQTFLLSTNVTRFTYAKKKGVSGDEIKIAQLKHQQLAGNLLFCFATY